MLYSDCLVSLAADFCFLILAIFIQALFSHSMRGVSVTASLIFDYICKTRKELNTLPSDGYLFTTNVSSTLPIAIANKYGLKTEITLTGFKFIGEKAREMETTGRGTYVFGFEESFGCLVSDCVRDKDSIQAILMLCETAAYYFSKGKDLVEALEEK